MQATATIKFRQRLGIKRPVIHILMADGRVTEMKDCHFVWPDSDNEGAGGVYAQLVTEDGTPYVTPDNHPAMLPVTIEEAGDGQRIRVHALRLALVPDPNKMVTWRNVAKLAGVSLSQAKRMVVHGTLPKPTPMGKRKVGFKQGEVLAALEMLKRPQFGK